MLLAYDAPVPPRGSDVPDRPSASANEGTIALAQRGDRAAWSRVIRAYTPLVHGVLLARARPSDIDDLVQDVFVLALERIPALREPSAFGAWIAQIARHRAIDAHRGRRRTEELDERAGKPDVDRAEAERVLRAIQSLPEAYREPLVLRLVEGMSGQEIAEQTGLSEGSVRVNLHRGMSLLRERLGITKESAP